MKNKTSLAEIIKSSQWGRRKTHKTWLVPYFFSTGEDPCWAQPFLFMLPPPLSMATLGEVCMQNKEVRLISLTYFLDMDFCIYLFFKTLFLTLFDLFQQHREKMDKTNVHWGLPDPSDGVWDCLLHQLHRYVLPRLQSHPIRHHGESDAATRP